MKLTVTEGAYEDIVALNLADPLAPNPIPAVLVRRMAVGCRPLAAEES
jgi:hypothetical protein